MNAGNRRCYQFGPFRLDPAEHRLLRDGQVVPLTPKAFDILSLLIRNNGRLVAKETLLQEVWPDCFVEEANLNRCVSVLRKALGDISSAPRYIETVPKRGYRFVAEVTETDAPAPLPTGQMRRALPLAGAAIVVGWIVVSVYPRGTSTTAANPPSVAHRQMTFTGSESGATISPDRRFLAYATRDATTQSITVADLSAGERVAIFNAPEAVPVRWSPDSEDLLFFARGPGMNGLHTIARTGGALRKIMDGQYVACWSPDGRTIAVGGYLGGRMWFVDRATGHARALALPGDRRSIWDLDWSPDNGRILVTSDDAEGRFAVSTLASDGGDERRVLEEEVEIHAARWAPGGGAVYYSRRTGQTVAILRVALDGDAAADASPIAAGLESDGRFSLSNDGQRLVYTRAPFHSNLWVVQPGDAKRPRGTTRELTWGTSVVERPAISPDGNVVAFTGARESAASVYTVPIAGGVPKPLTTLAAMSVSAAWSPDGRRVAFASSEGSRGRVWLADVHGGPPRPLSSGDMSETLDVVWGAGSSVMYQQRGNRDYYVLEPDTRRERLLLGGNTLGWTFSPVVSPDGRRIALAWNRAGASGIWTVDRDGTRARLLYPSHLPAASPVGWSADGRAVFAVTGERPTARNMLSKSGESTAMTTVMRVPADGSPATVLVTLPFDDVGGVAVSPDGRSIVCVVYSSRSDVWMIDNGADSGPQRRKS